MPYPTREGYTGRYIVGYPPKMPCEMCGKGLPRGCSNKNYVNWFHQSVTGRADYIIICNKCTDMCNNAGQLEIAFRALDTWFECDIYAYECVKSWSK